MTSAKTVLQRLHDSLNILQQRRAKYGLDAPASLILEIEDHQTAIRLTEQLAAGQLTETAWREQLQPLLVTIEERQATEAVTSLNMGGVSFGDISGSTITVGNINAGIHIYAGKPYTPPLIRPPRAQHFTDREQELKDLLADLQPGRVVTLCGPGGMGKTALATEAIYHLAPGETLPDRFPDGVYFYSFYNQPQAAVALEDMALAFGEEAKPTPQAAARRALANRRALLLLDGAEDADNLPAVLQAAPTCGVIITTRRHNDAPADFTDLNPLPSAEAVTLLRNWAGDQHFVDEATAQDICDLVGHLPLAVRLAGRYLARSGDSAADYLAWLRATPLEALDQGRRRHDSVDVLLTKSLDQVSDTAQQVLAVTGRLALASFDRAMMAAALASEVNALRRPLNELVNFGLLLRQEERYIISHALILTYARPLPQPAAVLPRLLVYFTALARQHHEQGHAGHERLDVERRHMMELLDRCTVEQAEVAFGLLRAVDGYFMYRGYNAERRLAWKMGLRLAEDAADNQEQANCIQALGDVHRRLAEYELARQRYEAARPIYEAIGARLGEANCIKALGDVHLRLAEYELARQRYEAARPIYEAIGARLGEANCIQALGDVHRMLDEYELARQRYEAARPIYEAIGARLGEANCIQALGDVHLRLAEYELARQRYEAARPIYEAIGDRLGEANCIKALGDVHRMLAEYELARQRYEAARPIYEAIGDRLGEANCIKALGDVHRMLAEYELARQRYEAARPIYEAIGHRLGETNVMFGLADLDRIEARWTEAQEKYQQALTYYQSIGMEFNVALAYWRLGYTAKGAGDIEQARAYYQQALSHFTAMGSPGAASVQADLDSLERGA